MRSLGEQKLGAKTFSLARNSCDLNTKACCSLVVWSMLCLVRPTRAFILFVTALAALVFGRISHANGQNGEPIPEQELGKFLGPVPPSHFTWCVLESIDFSVYYGEPHPPLTGSVGFYLGGFPGQFKPSPTTFKSRLGRFPVKWHRSSSADGAIHQEAIIRIDKVMGLKAHIWAEAPNENEMEKLLSVVGQLPTFSSGALPNRYQVWHDVLAEEQRIRRLIWASWSALVLACAWFVDRICRRRKRKLSATVRLLTLAGVIALSIGTTIGGLALSATFPRPQNQGGLELGHHQNEGSFVIDWFIKANGFLLLTAAGTVAALALLVATGLFLVRLFRNWNRRKIIAAR